MAAASRSRAASGSAGPSVDRQGAPVIDPTENVLALVAAAVERLNDLMAANKELYSAVNKRQDDMRDLEAKHIREVADLREKFSEKLAEKETERLNAIRAVDVGAVGKASEVGAAQAVALATQVATSAETLRTTVSASAAAAATALVQALEPIQSAIAELRKTQYEQQGQAAQRVEARTDQRGNTQNSQWIIGAILSGFAVMISLGGFIVILIKLG
jgi:maltodextrin utilization protein YvdJ